MLALFAGYLEVVEVWLSLKSLRQKADSEAVCAQQMI
jgi:hypothetical protein